MAVLGLDQIQKLIKQISLVEDLGERDTNNPEGCGLDFRIGSVNTITQGGAFIETDGEGGLGLRKGVQTEEVLKYIPNSKTQDFLTIKPNDYYLVSTIEPVNLPNNLMAQVYPRSSLFRAGLLLLVTKVDPGYKGKLIFGLTNLSPFDVKIQMGARICNIVFFEINGIATDYRGQHMGGRISPNKTERQV